MDVTRGPQIAQMQRGVVAMNAAVSRMGRLTDLLAQKRGTMRAIDNLLMSGRSISDDDVVLLRERIRELNTEIETHRRGV